jgi:hypothetical protein
MSINANNDALNEILETINELPISKEEQTKSIDITENGTTVVTPDDGMTLGEVTVNVEVESSGGEEFIGVKFSDFSGSYNTPKVADARSIPVPEIVVNVKNANYFAYWFPNASVTANGGYHVSLEDVYLPNDIIAFGAYMFYQCTRLTTLFGDFSKVIQIGPSAFQNCSDLPEIPYCPNLETISANAFKNCTSLTEVTLPSTVTSIVTNAFNGCSNLKKIYCKFAEDSVTGAPWGAPNADIEVVYVTEV